MAMTTSDILLTRQIHNADRAGLHYDIRLVQGGKAYSWATKKEMPEPGKSIMLYETSVHSADYALRKYIVIPKGNYGSGTTTLDFVRKAKITENKDKCHFVLETTKGERYLLKQMPIAGGKSWLFKNLGPAKPLEKSATTVVLYQHGETGRTTWRVEGQESPGPRWAKTNIKKHIARKKGSA